MAGDRHGFGMGGECVQIKKEEVAGRLYLAYRYSAGVLRRQKPSERAARRKKTSEGKRKINQLRRKYYLMQLMSANFMSGRDLFVCFEWAHEPTGMADEAARRALHRKLRRAYAQAGIEYKYISVSETHSRDGKAARLHHHMILTGLRGRDRALIQACWPHGGVDVRTLRELTDNFEDTCEYLLKERKPEGKRAYNTSQNLARPPEPLRRKLREGVRLELPPGVKLCDEYTDDHAFGGWQICVGKIIEPKRFAAYWEAAQRDRRRVEEKMSWRRAAARRRKSEGRKPLSSSKTCLTSEQPSRGRGAP